MRRRLRMTTHNTRIIRQRRCLTSISLTNGNEFFDTTALETDAMKPGSMLAILLFALVAIAHLLRLVNGLDVTVGGWSVPQWVSVGGVIVPAAIAYLLWRESR